MIKRLTRRSALSLMGTAAAGAVQKTPAAKALPAVGEFYRFADAFTETAVVRLTNLSSASYLPARENRAVSVKGRFLVFSSDRAGSLSPFRLDLRTGQVVQLLETYSLDSSSLCLDSSGRVLWLTDGHRLKQVALNNRRLEVLAQNVSSFSFSGNVQSNSIHDFLFIRDGGLYRREGSKALAQNVSWCQVRPDGGGCLFTRSGQGTGEELWYLSFREPAQPLREPARPLRLAQGPVAQPCWSPDGHSALFLRNRLICEVIPESGTEARIGGTSQFVAFSSNADGSVFVGAAQSKAQPTVNLLLRNPAREFTLCEHRANHPENCAPVFSADSRRVYFNSDFQGKPAIYSVNVEALIEETAG